MIPDLRGGKMWNYVWIVFEGSFVHVKCKMSLQLQCGGAEAKECACNMVATLVSQKDAIQPLLKSNVLRIIAPLLVDESAHVRRCAAGALRWVLIFSPTRNDTVLNLCTKITIP